MSISKNINVLWICDLCSEALGIVTLIPPRKIIVYAQDIPGLVGFRSKQDIIKVDNVTYIEVGTFFELLYENNLDCWLALASPKEFVDYDDFNGFNEKYKDLVNLELIKSIVEQSKNNLKKVSEKLVDYGNLLYICSMEAMIAESLLYSKEFKIQNVPLLQAMVDCRLREDTARLELDKVYANIDKHLETSEIEVSPNKELFNEELLKIRKIL